MVCSKEEEDWRRNCLVGGSWLSYPRSRPLYKSLDTRNRNAEKEEVYIPLDHGRPVRTRAEASALHLNPTRIRIAEWSIITADSHNNHLPILTREEPQQDQAGRTFQEGDATRTTQCVHGVQGNQVRAEHLWHWRHKKKGGNERPMLSVSMWFRISRRLRILCRGMLEVSPDLLDTLSKLLNTKDGRQVASMTSLFAGAPHLGFIVRIEWGTRQEKTLEKIEGVQSISGYRTSISDNEF